MILKVISYAALIVAANVGATVGVVGMTNYGGDVQMARLTRDVESLSVEVADLKQRIEVMGGSRAENDNHSSQYVLTVVELPPTEAELQDQRIRDRRGMQRLAGGD